MRNSSQWIRASSTNRCPVPGCGSEHFCWWKILDYPTTYVLCMKVSDGSFKTSMLRGIGKPAYHHIVDISIGSHTSLHSIEAEPIASPGQRNEAYEHLLTGYLNTFHSSYLKARSCPTEQYSLFRYTSMPASWKERDEIARQMAAKGLDLRGVPGFWYDKNEEWHMAGCGGVLMPIFNRDGLITGCQISPDDYIQAYVRYKMKGIDVPEKEKWKVKSKYIWLSSAPKKKTDDEGKDYLIRRTGTGAQASLHYPVAKPTGFLDDLCLEDHILVEGIHKANMVSCYMDGIIMAQAGTGASQVEAAQASQGASRFLIAYDRDWMETVEVRYALTSLIYQIANIRSLENVFVLYWPAGCPNGFDDVILSDSLNKVVDIPAEEWLAEYGITEIIK